MVIGYIGDFETFYIGVTYNNSSRVCQECKKLGVSNGELILHQFCWQNESCQLQSVDVGSRDYAECI